MTYKRNLSQPTQKQSTAVIPRGKWPGHCIVQVEMSHTESYRIPALTVTTGTRIRGRTKEVYRSMGRGN